MNALHILKNRTSSERWFAQITAVDYVHVEHHDRFLHVNCFKNCPIHWSVWSMFVSIFHTPCCASLNRW